jgi:hypothetical protein
MTSRPGYWLTRPRYIAGDRQVVVPVNDLLLTGAFAALFIQLYGILALGQRSPLRSSRATGSGATYRGRHADAFHRQHQAQRNLDIGRRILSASRGSKQRPDIAPFMVLRDAPTPDASPRTSSRTSASVVRAITTGMTIGWGSGRD